MSGQEKTTLTEDQAPCLQVSGGFSWLRGSGLGLVAPQAKLVQWVDTWGEKSSSVYG